MTLRERFQVQTVLVTPLQHQVTELLQLLHAQLLGLVVSPVTALLTEPGHPSLTREHVQVHPHTLHFRFQHVQLSDGLASGVVETGNVE